MPTGNPVQQPALGAWLARGIAAAAGILCFIALPTRFGWATRSVAAWDLAVLVLVCEGWFVILRLYRLFRPFMATRRPSEIELVR